MESKAFNDFIQARCEEILQSNNTYTEINNSVIESEKNLKKSLNEKQKELFKDFDKKVNILHEYVITFIYKNGLQDRLDLLKEEVGKNIVVK